MSDSQAAMDPDHIERAKAEFAALVQNLQQIPRSQSGLAFPCKGASCPCNMLGHLLGTVREAALRIPLKAAESVDCGLHVSLPAMFVSVLLHNHSKGALCEVASAYYQLVAIPLHKEKCRIEARAAASSAMQAAEAAALKRAAKAVSEPLLEPQLVALLSGQAAPQGTSSKPFNNLPLLWSKINKRLQKAVEALPESGSFSRQNAKTLGKWLAKGFDEKLTDAVSSSYAFVLWSASFCRVSIEPPLASPLAGSVLVLAAAYAASALEAARMIGRLSTAGITFEQQPFLPLIAASLDLAALLSCDLSTLYHARAQWLGAAFDDVPPQQQQQQQQPANRSRNTTRRLPDLRYGEALPAELLPGFNEKAVSAVLLGATSVTAERMHNLLAPVLCFFSCQLQQHLQAKLQQQQQPLTAQRQTPSTAAGSSSSSSSSSSGGKSVWAAAEGLLLCAVDKLQGYGDHHHKQQQQQELELSTHSQRYSQQAWQQLGFPPDLMQGLAVWYSDAGCCSRDSATSHLPSSSSSATTATSSSSGGSGSGGSPLGLPCSLFSATECIRFCVAAGVVLHGNAYNLNLRPMASEPRHIRGQRLQAVQSYFSLNVRAPQLLLGVLSAGMQLAPADTLPLVPVVLSYVEDALQQEPSVAGVIKEAEAAGAAAAGKEPQQQQQQQSAGAAAATTSSQAQQQQLAGPVQQGMAARVAPYALLTSQLTHLLQRLLRSAQQQQQQQQQPSGDAPASLAVAGTAAAAAAAAGPLRVVPVEGSNPGVGENVLDVSLAVQYCLSLMQVHAPTVQLYAQQVYADWPRCPIAALLGRGMACALPVAEAAARYVAAAQAAAAAAAAAGVGTGAAASSNMEFAVQLPFGALHMQSSALAMAQQLSCLQREQHGSGSSSSSSSSSGSGITQWQLLQAGLSLAHTSIKLQHLGQTEVHVGGMYEDLGNAFSCATVQDRGMDVGVWQRPLQQQQQQGAGIGAAPAALLLLPSLSATYSVLGRFLYVVGCKLQAMRKAFVTEAGERSTDSGDATRGAVGSSPALAWLMASTTLKPKAPDVQGSQPAGQQSVIQAEALQQLLIRSNSLLKLHAATAHRDVMVPFTSQLPLAESNDLRLVAIIMLRGAQNFVHPPKSEHQRRSTQMVSALTGLQRLHGRVQDFVLPAMQALIQQLRAASEVPGSVLSSSSSSSGRRELMAGALCSSLGELADLLKEVGGMLCAAMPSPLCCANPNCVSLATASEGFALVRGQAVVCGGCRAAGGLTAGKDVAARYCSVRCQAEHWPYHKAVCSAAT